ncbi:tol-pal system protein YbgF [Azonexus sp.]|jgi:tol-pal system protein YbgF|uniref:tol-pal system protein YbgF n=1 Tax=Azonexus sp. TaxID=1872668 RepID=UPI00282C3758|nr:tol-pal system protein YbgF [Azonexus sp.]MDR1994136.1 tol-pal system protein YbgF [Azonexus sp.]
MKRTAIVLLWAALALPVSPVWAGMFDDNEARQRVEDLRGNLDALTERVERIGRNQIDFVNQSEVFKTELADIRGQLEVLLNELEMAQKRQRDFYIDLDTRLRKLEAAPQPPEAGRPAAADPVQEGRDYEAALDLFKARKYKEANTAFMAFTKAWPGSSMLPSVHFWIASGYYQLKNFAAAADTFAMIATTWPSDVRAPDALLAQGNALTESGDTKGARGVLETLVAQYPNTAAAQTAKQQLTKKK